MNLGQKLVWDAVPGAVSYTAKLTTTSGGLVNEVTGLVTPEVQGSDLLVGVVAGASYNVSVWAIDALGQAGLVAVQAITVDQLPAPTNLQVV